MAKRKVAEMYDFDVVISLLSDAEKRDIAEAGIFPDDFANRVEDHGIMADPHLYSDVMDYFRGMSFGKKNPVGRKVTIQAGPDAGLTGLVSRKGQGGWFVEIEGIETGPYKVSSLRVEKVAKTAKKANFTGQDVFVEVDGEMIQGYVFEDDGGPMVEVSDPDDGTMGMGAPVMVERERIFTEVPNTAKKIAGVFDTTCELCGKEGDVYYSSMLGITQCVDGAACKKRQEKQSKKAALNTGDIYNALRDDRHNGYGYAVSTEKLPPSLESDADDAIVAAANSLGLDYEDLFMFLDSKPARWMREELADKMPPNRAEVDAIVRKYLNQQEINSLRSEVFAEFGSSVSEFDAFSKKAARGRSWQGFDGSGIQYTFIVEQTEWGYAAFIATGNGQRRIEGGSEGPFGDFPSSEAARAAAQQVIDNHGMTPTHDWYDSV